MAADSSPCTRKCGLACGRSSKPKHRLDGWRQVGRKFDVTGAGAVFVSFVLVAVEFDVEGLAHIRRGSFQFHGAALDRDFAYGEVVFFCELFDFGNRTVVGAMAGRELLARNGRAAPRAPRWRATWV